MKERPMIFSAPMVRAILAGTKTQTRRVVKWKGVDAGLNFGFSGLSARSYSQGWVLESASRSSIEWRCKLTPCPYGQPGDRLWVREAWMDLAGTGVEHRSRDGKLQRYAYGADTKPGSYGDQCRKDYGLKWRPSIHMPRAASRILLEITAIRVERLRDISEADALAEGVTPKWEPGCSGRLMEALGGFSFRPAASAYAELWEQINGPGAWDANPWVWVIEFKRVTP